MSRIAGAFALDHRPVSATVSRILELIAAPGVEGTARQVDRDDATLGFWGWETAQLAAEHGLVVALDGQIYNAVELGSTGSDAQLIARLYREHGLPGTLRRLNGDFALAVHDQAARTLWLARDRFGVKPLYYHRQPWGCLFASRPRALLRAAGIASDPDHRFVACFAGSHYRTFDNEPARSPYRHVDQLQAGHFLEVREGGASERPWWTLDEQPDLPQTEEELAEQYRALLLDAVRIRVRGARRAAFTLSGGMDSSSVIAAATSVTGDKQVAYSSVYEDPTYDETAEIRTILDSAVSRWNPVKIAPPDVPAVIARMIEANDEPVATATWLSHFLLCEEVRRGGHRSLFGGLGGDELNAGEYEYFYFFFADLKRQGQDRLLEQEIAKWIEYHDHPVFKKSFEAARLGLERLVDLSHPGICRPDPVRLGRYADLVQREYFDLSRYQPVMDHPFASYLKNRTYQDIFRETAPCCLRAADRQTTAFGLDVCWPFFDHRLVELMFRVPGTMKIRAGVTKHLLRLAMTGVLPEETRTRIKKTGWNAPAHLWFSGRGREFLLDLIGSRAFNERGIYDVGRVRRLADEHQEIVISGRPVENHMMFFWQLVNLELWLRAL
jgi:asparagine synthase (glutamine-hydrolysing)